VKSNRYYRCVSVFFSLMPSQQQQHRRAIILMTCALAILICLDAGGKYLGQAGVPVAASTWSRYVGHLLVVLALFYPREGIKLFRPQRPVIQWARGLLMVAVTLLYFAALKYLPLAEATALFFLTPIITTGLAAWLLHERPSRWTLIAIALGFAGVLVVARPGSELALTGVLLVIAAAFCNAGYQTLTRSSSSGPNAGEVSRRSERVGTQLLYSGLVGTIVMTAALPFWWDGDWIASANTITRVVFLAVGALGALGHLLLIRAFTLAPASTLAPWMYIQLLWSALIGWFVFGHAPDWITVVGMLLIGLSPQLTRFDRRA
jgi:drug/metabolite transporter (DMT)-like permease